MPTYQYACTACGHQLEAVQSFADEPLTECPSCEGRLRKLFSSVGVVFKGSGFYRNDSRGTPKSEIPAQSTPSSETSSSTEKSTTSSTSSSSGEKSATPAKSEPAKSSAAKSSAA